MHRKILAAALLYAVSGSALAAQQTINAEMMSFSPLVLYVNPGDTVTFEHMIGHNAESIAGMMPPGATAWASKMGEDGFSVKLEQPGAYLYKCAPHFSSGMVGAIVVGDGAPSNLTALETALKDITLAKHVVTRLLKKLREDLQANGRSG